MPESHTPGHHPSPDADQPTSGGAVPEGGRIVELDIQRELKDSYLTYAMSTIMDRALPDVRDGLKPSQRRILVAMNDLNLRPGSKHLKCAKIAGNTSGAAITLRSVFEDGEDGEFVTIINVGTDDVMLQDQTASPDSNLRLVASRVKLGPRHSIGLVYLSSVKAHAMDRGDWVQIGNVVPVL